MRAVREVHIAPRWCVLMPVLDFEFLDDRIGETAMKTLPFVTLCLVSAAFWGCTQTDGMQGMHMGHEAVSQKVYPAGSIDLKNTICVVSGDKVGDSPFTEIYEGKIYHFCCADCPVDFKKDPAKFAKMLAADPAKYGVAKGI